MKYPLYDHEIDAVPFLKEVRDQQSRWRWQPLAGWLNSHASKAKTKGDPAPSGDWIARLSLLGMMGVGVLLGSILSLPIIFVFLPASIPLVAVLFFLLLLVPVLKTVSGHIKGKLLAAETVRAVVLKRARTPRKQAWAKLGVVITFFGGIAVIVLVTHVATSPSRRQIVSPNRVVVWHKPPKGAATGSLAVRPARSPVIDSSRVPVVVPPLLEEPESPVAAIAEADLRELRDRYRRDPIIGLDPIMDGVRRTCDSNAWQRRGWRDYQLEFALEELIYRVKRATEQSALELPVRFGEVPAGIAESPFGVLAAMRTRHLNSIRGSILLVDGDIELSYADHCLILATGKVKIRQGEENFIIAGDSIDVRDENVRSGPAKSPLDLQEPSLWISGASIKMSYGRRLICAAPDGIEAHCIRQSKLVNSPIRRLTQITECSEHTSGRINLSIARSKSAREPKVRRRADTSNG
jgi:hypothetical protein